jgi:NAD(P)-dependent dehydrogenase (short-subunit alcohol dehydrogenase family)
VRRAAKAEPANQRGILEVDQDRNTLLAQGTALATRVEAAFLQVLPSVQPLPGMARAEDIAAAAVFLASDEARFVNGHDLIVDDGLCAGRPASVRIRARNALRDGVQKA